MPQGDDGEMRDRTGIPRRSQCLGLSARLVLVAIHSLRCDSGGSPSRADSRLGIPGLWRRDRPVHVHANRCSMEFLASKVSPWAAQSILSAEPSASPYSRSSGRLMEEPYQECNGSEGQLSIQHCYAPLRRASGISHTSRTRRVSVLRLSPIAHPVP